MSTGVKIPIRPLGEFCITLKQFSDKLNQCFTEMESAIKQCGHEWQDDKYEEFQAEFTQHVKKLQPLSEELIVVKSHAEQVWIPIIEEYLRNNVKS